MTYHLLTFGCQMNKSDSERIGALLQNYGFMPAPKNKADLIILNACSVRQAAIDRIYGVINQIKSIKNKSKIFNLKSKIILTGCLLPSDRKKFSERVDLILSITDLPDWSKKISKILKTNQSKIPGLAARSGAGKKIKSKISNIPASPAGGQYPISNIFSSHPPKKNMGDYFLLPANHQSRFTAYLPIMTGCNNYCSYCVVPFTRGREYSRPAADVINEVYTLIKQGYQEIILLGQNVNSYKGELRDIPSFIRRGGPPKPNGVGGTGWSDFPSLLSIIDKIHGDYWLNFISSHPKDLSQKLINCFGRLKHLTPYLHLALQSGSAKILKAMNRRYAPGGYLKKINTLRRRLPDLAVTTDIIVGFPGETQKDFLATANLIKKLKFDMAYLAAYSPRAGTAAAKLIDNIPHAEKNRRLKILNNILKKTAFIHNKQLIGKTLTILVDSLREYSRDHKKNSRLFAFYGHTNQFKHVKIKTKNKTQLTKLKIGHFIKIKITAATPWGLKGKIINSTRL